ncbi:MAG: hypothetical protein N3I86_10935 [Verrucomicrobiae bacterium]|nr:hypothetical protein [Verrucomicrobiae bacterium]MDW8309939.1 hypothetical protein [Verrucomicrobiales bacterium]
MSSMRPSPESESFEALRRALKLKHYEKPPPGYFEDFPRRVMAQIRAGRFAEPDTFWERLTWEVPWLTRFVEALFTRPAVAMGFGGAVCAVLIGGLIYSENVAFNPPKPVTFVPIPEAPVVSAPAPTPVIPSFGIAHQSDLALLSPLTNGSLNPPLPMSGSLFDHFRVSAQPVGFPAPNSAP